MSTLSKNGRSDKKGFAEKTMFSDILPVGRVIFSHSESDIETYGFSDILFANKLAKRITLCEAQYHCEAI